MRKVLLLVIVSLLMSVVFASAAYAHPSRDVVFYGNEQSGSVSYGDHGYSWYHSDSDSDYSSPIIGSWSYYYDRDGNKHYYHKQNNRWRADHYFKWVSDRDGEWNYYVDANGVSHYFYLDPDREYEVYSYKDANGATQYEFVDVGWKA
ncbi:hypothetical protein [Pelotomaculum propionicicum]|uniref:Uncharacterized protein n=1 Tax=Pelotomaculum propionicicum TaxID=258475 RepID=A0A4Y7RR49_9FIRM|nr:hypothetical protein [Pelotomaculum propionicicum]NLI14208.1 hypothetical protein [Peptococcaceae bacterium]TEB11230.1 hypothetical protein Pmgp_01765 [Pelotomaculum propionicicum]